ncbi:hypothetical protein HN51_038866 [Arachis hypogaea]|nr:GATA zinc finger domain-containing protein 14-like [Arachis ipaensis]XP_025663697.1 GATA zinc finger domain-containing protein 14 [Arachis hypogaea]QHN84306.1 uncharacterized protein DS421_16g527530 [Arachis hypogaea]
MEKNNTKSSTSTICSKIREALSSYPAFRAIHHRLNNNQNNKHQHNHRSSAPNSITITKKHANNSRKMNKEGGRGDQQGSLIPINYDYSNNNHNKVVVEPPKQVAAAGKNQPASSTNNNNNKGVMKIQQETLDLNGAFKEFIDRVRNGINGAEHTNNNNNAAGSALSSNHEANKKMENQKDHHFSEFIQSSRKKLRTTSNIASFKRG